MFRAGQANPYDEIVAKTTDENLTSENWELILNLCDKVVDEGELGARNVVAAVLKRLAHRNANVQLYALTLAEALVKNCTIVLHREVASRSFTQGLEKIITDRTTHDKVKKRALHLIAEWSEEFSNEPSLGIMEECYTNLKSKGYKFSAPSEPPPPEVDDAVRRREEEELQRVLEMSVRDKGGRGNWSDYSAYGSSSSGGAGSSGPSSSAPSGPPASSGYVPAQPSAHSSSAYAPNYNDMASARYNMPARADTPVRSSTAQTQPSATASPTVPQPSQAPSAASSAAPARAAPGVVTRVRALHTFEPTEAGELAFEKGDIIKVVDRGYKDWWRGQLKGRTGIFPVNYVEPLPEPTSEQLAREAEQEAAVFSQAANVDKLLTMLRQFDGSKDNLADNEEIQELYRTSMGLRPKIVKLIDKYSQKRADLVSMNESFVKARSIYERMMEQSLAKLAEEHDTRPIYRQQYSSYAQQPSGPPPGPQPYGWPAGYDQVGYNATYPNQQYPPESQYPPQGQQPQYPPEPQYPPQGQQPQHPGAPYGPQYGQQPQPGAQYPALTPTPGAPYPNVPPTTGAYGPHQHHQQPSAPQQHPHQPAPVEQPQSTHQSQSLPQPQVQPQPQMQPQMPPEQHQQAQAQPQSPPAGPPYVYDPNTTYADPNVQAWAQYFAKGGKDITGAVYFISVPGVKEAPGAQPAASQPQPAALAQPEPQVQQPGLHRNISASAMSVVSTAPSEATIHAMPQRSPTASGTSFVSTAPSDVSPYGQPSTPHHQSSYPVQPISATAVDPSQPAFPAVASPHAENGSSTIYPGYPHGAPAPTFSRDAQQHPPQQHPPQQQPVGAPGPYAPSSYGNVAGAVYPAGGYQPPSSPIASAHPQSPEQAAAPWSQQYQALPAAMAGMSVASDGSHGQPPQGVGA